MRILKFGGTSLADPARIAGAAAIVERAARGGRVAVVVSALAGITDALTAALGRALAGEASAGCPDLLARRHLDDLERLLDVAEQRRYEALVGCAVDRLARLLEGVALLGECPAATRDLVLATGERLAAPLFAATLRGRGLAATAFDGSALIVTATEGCGAVEPQVIRQRVGEVLGKRPAGEVAVVAGFVASDRRGRTTTLGRGASDYSATLLAAALDAELVEIWTDVDGVLSADPRHVPRVLPLPHLTYREAADLACFGARVLHPKTLEPLAPRGIPIHIRNTLRPDEPGTRIDGAARAAATTRAVTAIPEVVRFHLRPTGRMSAATLALTDRLGEALLLAAWETPGRLSLVVREDDAEELGRILARSADRGVCDREELALVVVHDAAGPLMTGTAGEVLDALAAGHVAVRGLELPGASPRCVAVLVERPEMRRAVRLLHHRLIDQPAAKRAA